MCRRLYRRTRRTSGGERRGASSIADKGCPPAVRPLWLRCMVLSYLFSLYAAVSIEVGNMSGVEQRARVRWALPRRHLQTGRRRLWRLSHGSQREGDRGRRRLRKRARPCCDPDPQWMSGLMGRHGRGFGCLSPAPGLRASGPSAASPSRPRRVSQPDSEPSHC
jgi:hypothetical protein